MGGYSNLVRSVACSLDSLIEQSVFDPPVTQSILYFRSIRSRSSSPAKLPVCRLNHIPMPLLFPPDPQVTHTSNLYTPCPLY